MVKCLVCGAVFSEDVKVCPVCGVGPENFRKVEETGTNYHNNTQDTYIVLGGGAAAVTAADEIRQRDATGTVIMVTNEELLPYNRPMLTKQMSLAANPQDMEIHPESWYDEREIGLMRGFTVETVSPSEKRVHLAGGVTLIYDKLIYALGAESFIPPVPGREKQGVVAIRRPSDIEKITSAIPRTKRAVVIGGGVLGLEAAWSIREMGVEVTVLEAADGLMTRQLDDVSSKALEKIAAEKGLVIVTGAQTAEITGEDAVTGVSLKDGTHIPCELVVFSCGVRATTGPVNGSVTIDRGVVVDDHMLTSAADVYACGDCAQPASGALQLYSFALETGKVAGANATGDAISYSPITAPMTMHALGTSLFQIGDAGKGGKEYELRDSSRPEDGQIDREYYLNGRLAGAILIGDTSKMGALTVAYEQK